MGKQQKIRKLRREGKIPPVRREKRTPKWVKAIIIAVLVLILTFSGLGLWGYLERDVAAKVGKETITQTSINNQFNYYVQMYQQFGMDLTSPEYATTKKSVLDYILNSSIEESLLVQYAKAHNLTYDQDTFDKNMSDEIDNIIKQGQNDNGEQTFNDLVNARYGSLDGYKEYLKKALKDYVERPLLMDAALNEQYKVIDITDQDIKDYWNSVYSVDAEHLLIKVDSATATKKEKEDAKKLAEDTYKEILAEKEKQGDTFNFATFAKSKAEELNKAESAAGKEVARYEALGYFEKGAMVKPFEDACFDDKNEVGSIVGVIETDFGYHIIHILGKKKANEKYDEPEKVNVRLVQFNFDSTKQESIDAAKQSATSISIQTKKGMSFLDAVERFSEDETTKKNKGETGLFSRTEKPELFDVAWKLPVDGISDPIKLSSAYAVIQVIEKKEAVKATLENKEIYDKVKEDLTNIKKDEIKKSFIETLKKQYKVRTTNPWKSMGKFFNTHFGDKWAKVVAWWNKATGKTTETTTTETNTNGTGTDTMNPSNPEEPLNPVTGQ